MARGNNYYFRFQPDFFLFLVYLFVVRLLDLCLRTSSCREPRSQKVMMEVTVGGGGGEWEGVVQYIRLQCRHRNVSAF